MSYELTNASDLAAVKAALGIDQVTPYLGLVATRCRVPIAYTTSFKEINARTVHIARDAITAIRLAFGSWYQVAGGTTEQGSSATSTLYASVEYPIGSTPQRIKWSDANSLSAADKTFTVSDELTLSTAIPRGAKFIVRQFLSNPNGIVFGSYMSASAGDGATFYAGTGNTDQTLNASASLSSGGGNILFPLAILGVTSRRSVAYVGDSLFAGSAEPTGVSTVGFDVGVGERLFAPEFAGVNIAQGGSVASGFYGANAALRRNLLAYVTDVVANFGVNDLAGLTAAQLEANLTTLSATVKAASGPAKRYWHTTTTPVPSATSDNWMTLSGQTVDATANPRRIIFNSDLRNGCVPGVDGFIEVADGVEPYRDSGQYTVTGARTVTDAGITSGAAVLSSASASFTPDDVGTFVSVAGAGAAGAALSSTIITYTSATSVTLANNASTTVSGATARVGVTTNDGVHGAPAVYSRVEKSYGARARARLRGVV